MSSKKERQLNLQQTSRWINIIYWVSIIFLVFLTTVIVANIWSQLQILNNKSQPLVNFNFITNWLLSFVLEKQNGPNGSGYVVPEAEVALKIILDSFVCLITFFVVIHPFYARKKARIETENKQPIRILPIGNKGSDDLATMLAYYKIAEEVIVYSGNFGWFGTNIELRNRMRQLADHGKIKFVCSGSEASVQRNLGQDFFNRLKQEDQIKFVTDHKIRCSLIKIGSTNVLLYLTNEGSVTDWSMCVVFGKEKARLLLEAMSNLMLKPWSQ